MVKKKIPREFKSAQRISAHHKTRSRRIERKIKINYCSLELIIVYQISHPKDANLIFWVTKFIFCSLPLSVDVDGEERK